MSTVITEGFYRWADVVWNWPKVLDKYDRQALGSVLNNRVLSLPNHPLRESGKAGVELYIGTFVDGTKKLLFSMRQVEYIVEYIYRLRLNDPAWLEYLHQKKVCAETASGSSTSTIPAAPPINRQIRRLSLPDRILPKDFFISIEGVILTGNNVKILDKNIRKENKEAAKRKKSGGRTPTSLDGLESDASAGSMQSSQSSPESDYNVLQAGDNPDEWQASVAQVIQDAQNGPAEPDPADYFDLAQQALFAASHGGTINAVKKRNGPGWCTPEMEALLNENLTPATGRGLFLALEMRARDDDPTQAVDLGYAAVWYVPDSDNPNGYGQVHECGHVVAKEERDNVSDYFFGTTEVVPRTSLTSWINRKILQLWLRAGKGPIYIIMHSSQSDYTTFGPLGLPVGEWHDTLDPVQWAHPGHATPEATGQRMLLDTALLFGAVEVGQPGAQVKGGATTRNVKEILHLLNPGGFDDISDTDNSGNKAMLTYILFDTLLDKGKLSELRDMLYLHFAHDFMGRSVANGSTADADGASTAETASTTNDTSSTAVTTATGATNTADRDANGHNDEGSDDNATPPAKVSDEDEDDEDFAGVQAFYTNAEGELVPIGDYQDEE